MTFLQLSQLNSVITRCNAGRNRHEWRHQFALWSQLQNQSADNCVCSLRDLNRKCDLNQGWCGYCKPTQILGQILSRVEDNTVRIKLIEMGEALTLDRQLQSSDPKRNPIYMLYHSNKATAPSTQSDAQRAKATNTLQGSTNNNDLPRIRNQVEK